jgi:Spy/CpxP family protein refolding chaperone
MLETAFEPRKGSDAMYRVIATGILCLGLILAGGQALGAQDGPGAQKGLGGESPSPAQGMMAHKKCMKRCMTGAMAGKHGKGGKAGKGKMAGKGGAGGGKGRCAGKRGCPREQGGGLLAGGGLMKLMMGHMALAAPDAAALGPLGPFGRGLPRRWDLSGLELTPEQRAELRELAYRHLKSLHELQAKRNALRLEAVYLLGAEKLDAQRLEKVYADLGKAQAKLLANSRSYLDGLRSLLSAEQLSGLQP